MIGAPGAIRTRDLRLRRRGCEIWVKSRTPAKSGFNRCFNDLTATWYFAN